jgi:hypothetical protein
LMTRKTNSSVHWAVGWDVSWDVWGAVYDAVDDAVWGAVDVAVSGAVWGAVDVSGAVVDAVDRTVDVHSHPGLQDFLRSCTCGEVGEI